MAFDKDEEVRITDHFKDNNEQDGQAVRSFKEQILAELEEAHRLRRLREEALRTESDQEDSNNDIVSSEVDTIETLESSEQSTESEVFEQLEESYVEEVQPTQDKVVFMTPPQEEDTTSEVADLDLEATIPMAPLTSEQLGNAIQEEQLEQEVDLDVLTDDLKPQDKDLSITRVMAGFNKLFDDAEKAVDYDKMTEFPVVEDSTEDSQAHIAQQHRQSDVDSTELVSEEEGQYLTKHQKRTRTNKVARKISMILLSLLTILILATGFFVYRYVDSSIKPLDAKSTEYIQVEIPSGSGNKLIGKILEESGVIKSGQVFNYYVKFKNYTNFQSGFYNFQKSMSLDDIATKLQEGGTPEPERPALGKILIPEGYTLEQIAKAVALNANTSDKKDKTPFTEKEFMSIVQDEAFIAKMVEKFPGLLGSLPSTSEVRYQLEGYLFPATYSYYEETTLENIVEQMLATMDVNLSPYYSSIANNGMTVNQVLSLASLVEKEGATDDDRKLIAGVFYNRLNQGMPLQSNIAILYAMGKLGQATTLLEDATIDTGIASPFNIYVNPGLMPGPVDSPSLSAIKATIDPQQSNYLYFVADVTTGAVYYAENYDEHSANVEKYINSQLSNSQ